MQEEVQKLQAEVAQLDIKLAEVNQILAKATVARKDERYSTEKTLAALGTSDPADHAYSRSRLLSIVFHFTTANTTK